MPADGTRGFADWIMPLMRQANIDKQLQYAFNACGMALLNNKGGSQNKLNDKALFEYTRALAATNEALRDPKTQTSDSTLAAVLLLGTYEVDIYATDVYEDSADSSLTEHYRQKDRNAVVGLSHRGCYADCESSGEEATPERRGQTTVY